MSTPAVAVAVSTGHVNTTHTFRYGIYLEILGLVIIMALIFRVVAIMGALGVKWRLRC